MYRETDIRKMLSDELLYLYNTGKCYHAYKSFGAQLTDGGVQFTVWAPDVKSVRVVGEFNSWGKEDNYLQPIESSGVFTGFIEGLGVGAAYKYDIEMPDGKHVLKADPFAFKSELRPDTASLVADLTYSWKDESWIRNRERSNFFNLPMNIYEVHLGSWKRHDGEDGFYTYKELAETLVPYVKDMGYTHIEILPVMEHPLDASWGYQVTGYYAASSRYGDPVDLMYLVDCCHNEGIGVILDWVPGHFCPDEHGLASFNGSMLYENEIHPEWGTYKFDFGRTQVRSFLLSNAMFWLDKFHVDGLRVDGVSSMLYLNFGISDSSKKKFNKNGGDENLEAISFIREFNQMVGSNFPGVFTAAEESSAWPLVTKPPQLGGLGFHFKWNMGWMNDVLDFVSTDFIYRSYDHNKMTFSMSYAFSENYILPLSHDEVVHGKKSIIGRMPGDIWRQFAGLRLLAMYQMTHPGKKLNFMGHEIAQFIEWREYEGLEWFLLGYENHSMYQNFVKALNHVYLENKELWECDNDWAGFTWIDPDNNQQNILSYVRKSEEEPVIEGEAESLTEDTDESEGTAEVEETAENKDALVVLLNFNVQSIDRFRVGVPYPGKYKEIINTDDAIYGGNGRCNTSAVTAEEEPMHGMPYSIEIKMPVLGGTIFRRLENVKGYD